MHCFFPLSPPHTPTPPPPPHPLLFFFFPFALSHRQELIITSMSTPCLSSTPALLRLQDVASAAAGSCLTAPTTQAAAGMETPGAGRTLAVALCSSCLCVRQTSAHHREQGSRSDLWYESVVCNFSIKKSPIKLTHWLRKQ